MEDDDEHVRLQPSNVHNPEMMFATFNSKAGIKTLFVSRRPWILARNPILIWPGVTTVPTKSVPAPSAPIPMFALPPTTQNTLHVDAEFTTLMVLSAPTVSIPGIWNIHIASGFP